MPPFITMLPDNPRSPYPITWREQDALFRRLPPHLARMALFAVNTGLRDSNVCGLQWQWEVAVPEVDGCPSGAMLMRRVGASDGRSAI